MPDDSVHKLKAAFPQLYDAAGGSLALLSCELSAKAILSMAASGMNIKRLSLAKCSPVQKPIEPCILPALANFKNLEVGFASLLLAFVPPFTALLCFLNARLCVEICMSLCTHMFVIVHTCVRKQKREPCRNLRQQFEHVSSFTHKSQHNSRPTSLQDLHVEAATRSGALDFEPLTALTRLHTLRVTSLREPINLDRLMAQVPLRELYLYGARLASKRVPYSSPTLECIFIDSLSPGCDLLSGKFPALKSLLCTSIDLNHILEKKGLKSSEWADNPPPPVVERVREFVQKAACMPLVMVDNFWGQEEGEADAVHGDGVLYSSDKEVVNIKEGRGLSSLSLHGSLVASALQELSPLAAAFSGVHKLDLRRGGWRKHPDPVLFARTLGGLFPNLVELRMDRADSKCPLLEFVRAFPSLKHVSVSCDSENIPDAVSAALVACAMLNRTFTLTLIISWWRQMHFGRARRGSFPPGITEKYPGAFPCIQKMEAQWQCLQASLPGVGL